MGTDFFVQLLDVLRLDGGGLHEAVLGIAIRGAIFILTFFGALVLHVHRGHGSTVVVAGTFQQLMRMACRVGMDGKDISKLLTVRQHT